MDQLRFLSYNIQAGIDTCQYSDYLTKGWKHLLPHRERLHNLNRIASLVHGFDFVALQEVDAGSIRSGFIDQTEYLAHHARFPYWYRQVNRKLGRLARHSNGLLSRVRPSQITEHKLPGFPGRGAIIVELETTDGGILAVCTVHLSLGSSSRRRQLAYIHQLAVRYPYLILLGDFNCDCDSRPFQELISKTDLRGLDCERRTFPSWRPWRNLDHILVSRQLSILDARVVDFALSDHLPLSAAIRLPSGVALAP